MTLVRHDLIDAPLDGTPAVERSRITRIDLGPGAPTGLHQHPCDVVGYILEGTVRFQLEGRPERLLRAGDAFHEPKNTRVAHFDNISDTETVTFLACYLLGPGVNEVIEML